MRSRVPSCFWDQGTIPAEKRKVDWKVRSMRRRFCLRPRGLLWRNSSNSAVFSKMIDTCSEQSPSRLL